MGVGGGGGRGEEATRKCKRLKKKFNPSDHIFLQDKGVRLVLGRGVAPPGGPSPRSATGNRWSCNTIVKHEKECFIRISKSSILRGVWLPDETRFRVFNILLKLMR